MSHHFALNDHDYNAETTISHKKTLVKPSASTVYKFAIHKNYVNTARTEPVNHFTLHKNIKLNQLLVLLLIWRK